MSRLLFSADVQFEAPEVSEVHDVSEAQDVAEVIPVAKPAQNAEIKSLLIQALHLLSKQDPTVLDDVNTALAGGQADE